MFWLAEVASINKCMTFPTTASGRVASNGIEIYYETFGKATNPAVLLIMGLDAQCVMWSMDFVLPLTEAGYYVIRFDNRDLGLSTWIRDWHHRRPYTLEDMALDAVGLLDGLSITKAHIIGASMGGMIAQRIAISHQSRVLSLTSIMSSGYVLNPKASKNLTTKIALRLIPFIVKNFKIKNKLTHPDVSVRTYVATYKKLAGTKYPYNKAYFERLFSWSIIERKGQNPNARMQQYCAIAASGSRLAELPQVKAPTLVLHGTADRLVKPIHAKIYAPLIANSTLVWLDGVGHEIPKAALPQIHQEILRLFRKAE
jgi:pimeloyl-ACP methyl ester carboxylesterase